MNEKTVINGPVYDARTLGTPKMLVLGIQHMFAMFSSPLSFTMFSVTLAKPTGFLS